MARVLSIGLELYFVHRYSVEPRVQLVDGAHDGQAKLAVETGTVERIRGLHHEDAEVLVEREWMGVPDLEIEVGAVHFARQRLFFQISSNVLLSL